MPIQRKLVEDIEGDMTPMIDVTFQLLIFFILTMKMKTEEGKLKAYLPKDKGQKAIQHVNTKKDLEDIRIKLKSLGGGVVEVRVGDTPIGNTSQMRPSRLYRTLEAQIKTFPSDLPCVIDGDFGVPFQDVVWALNAAISANITEINFTVPQAAYQWKVYRD